MHEALIFAVCGLFVGDVAAPEAESDDVACRHAGVQAAIQVMCRNTK